MIQFVSCLSKQDFEFVFILTSNVKTKRVRCRVAPTGSHSVTGVKQPRAGLVLGWVIGENVRQAQRLKLTLNAMGA